MLIGWRKIMKKIIILLLIFLICITGYADMKQPMPVCNNLEMMKKVKLFIDVKALQIIENKDLKGVIAIYEKYYSSARTYKGQFCHTDSTSNNRGELIFIVGLNHNILTNDCYIYQKKNFNHYYVRMGVKICEQEYGKCLYLWPIGIETRFKDGRRLKKYTVNPLEAYNIYTGNILNQQKRQIFQNKSMMNQGENKKLQDESKVQDE